MVLAPLDTKAWPMDIDSNQNFQHHCFYSNQKSTFLLDYLQKFPSVNTSLHVNAEILMGF